MLDGVFFCALPLQKNANVVLLKQTERRWLHIHTYIYILMKSRERRIRRGKRAVDREEAVVSVVCVSGIHTYMERRCP